MDQLPETVATAEAAQLDAATHPVLKPWILPSGNAGEKGTIKVAPGSRG